MLLNIVRYFAANPGEPCSPAQKVGFFEVPTWYKYLPGKTDLIDPSKCIPDISEGRQITAIGLGIIDILLYIGGFVAVAFVIYGGFQYMISQGEPDRTAGAKNTIVNAMIGLVIVLTAIAIVSFIGNRLR